MGIIKTVKNTLTKRKDKKAKGAWKMQLVWSLVILAIVLFIGSFTAYGAYAFQYFIDNDKEASWAPGLQWRTANLFYFWGETKAAYHAYEKYYTLYPKHNPAQAVKAEMAAVNCLRDALQFASCYNKLLEFLDKYAAYQTEPWYADAVGLKDYMDNMPVSKKIDNPWF